jgi:hypothetical protein
MAKRRGAIVPYSGRSYIELVYNVKYRTLSPYTLHYKFCLEAYRYSTEVKDKEGKSDCSANSLVGDKAKACTPFALLSDSLDHFSENFFFFFLSCLGPRPPDRGYVTSHF